MGEGEEDEANERPEWRKDVSDGAEEFARRPPEDVEGVGEDGTSVGGHGEGAQSRYVKKRVADDYFGIGVDLPMGCCVDDIIILVLIHE